GCTSIEFLQHDARVLRLSEPVDWLITECMGNFFVTDEMQPVLRDAKRFLGAGGRTIPQSIRLYIAPVWLPLWNELDFWREPIGGLDYRGALDFATNRSYVLHVEPEFVIGKAVLMDQFPLLESPDRVGGHYTLSFGTSTRCDGVIGWFDAQLTDTIVLTTGPSQRTHWGQMLFPIDPRRVTPATSLRFELELALDPEYQWTFRWSGEWGGDASGTPRFEHDSRWRFGRPDPPSGHSN
ncbi:MAG: hypothetical protein KC609_11930, partial [Myxococcales bacterium]|nr:hypothetical protein [Myxococcales bacterium]